MNSILKLTGTSILSALIGIVIGTLCSYMFSSFDVEADEFFAAYLTQLEGIKFLIFVVMLYPIISKLKFNSYREALIFGGVYGLLYPIVFVIPAVVMKSGINFLMQYRIETSVVVSFIFQILIALGVIFLLRKKNQDHISIS